MKKYIFLTPAFFLPFLISAQNKFTVSGYVSDYTSGERLIGATVYNSATGKGAVCNNYGFFSLSDKEGNSTLVFQFVGYKKKRVELNLTKDTLLNIRLERGIEIEEVEVKGFHIKQNNPELSTLNQPKITMQTIETAPVILGEHDVLKTLQFLPGIKQGAENTAGFNVRGGSADQNLILLDGVPVYNVNHMMGFFSVFNTDAIKNVNFIKGGIPARYGGKLSSILDISMKEGNLKESSGIFSISPMAARFTYEAPIKQDTAAFIVSLRRTFFDIPMVAFEKINGENGSFGYNFYDINIKTNWILNPKNRLYFSFYTGKDKQFATTKEKDSKTIYNYRWGNFTSVFRWNKVFTSKLFSNTSIYYSLYNHNELIKIEENNKLTLFKTSSDLQDIALKSDFDFYVSPQYTIRFGGKLSQLVLNPNIIQVKDAESDISFNDENKTRATQSEIYFENAFDLQKLKLNIGARLSGYSTGKTKYLNFQPRLSANLELSSKLNMSASYTKMAQNIHLLTNSSLGMPTDLWVASTDRVGPQEASQATFGLSRQIQKDYTISVEAYYKWMKDVVRFDEGAAFLDTKESSWDKNVLVGDGKAYGVEWMVQKNSGNLTGMLSYTLSWSERRFDGLNHGRWFPFKFDRRHDVSLLATYKFKKYYEKIRSLSIGFTLQSGNNISLPDFEYAGLLTPGREFNYYHDSWETVRQTYDHPNNFRMPAFHHLDIGYNIVKQKTDRKSITWTFSVYNVYNRMNPWYYQKDKNDKIKQVSLFPFFPSVGFTYRW